MIVIAENINVMSKSLGPAMKERNAEPIIKMAKALEANGADILDLNVGFARKGGPELMEWIVKTVQSAVSIPLSLDTMNMEAMEAALKAYDPTPGPALINSISAIPERMEKMLPLAAEYKARFVALMYATDGIPRDSNERGALAAELLYHGMEAGLAVEDMFFDPVVVPVSSQQEQVVSCTEFTAMIGEIAPGCNSTCGLSNVSNGSPEHLRDIINQTYLIILKNLGMTSAIMDGLDKEIIAIAKGQRPELEALVMKAYNGESIDMGSLDKKQQDYVKTVKILTNQQLYSDSWLEL